ncbi:hypothetical protein Pcinc_038345 [Petrolisthes cinctipes]|uniref:Uncharacterized protein n=1 Tax=Petrolisthes cinctipes TaxID=88211 RepID=A0AAE1ELP1_PETCI|nr:hypothetical protein Pcinc_038345 [Petrolisthes cinctipes]
MPVRGNTRLHAFFPGDLELKQAEEARAGLARRGPLAGNPNDIQHVSTLQLVCRSALSQLARTECAFHPKEARASEALWEGQLGAMRHWGDQASNSTCHFDH